MNQFHGSPVLTPPPLRSILTASFYFLLGLSSDVYQMFPHRCLYESLIFIFKEQGLAEMVKKRMHISPVFVHDIMNIQHENPLRMRHKLCSRLSVFSFRLGVSSGILPLTGNLNFSHSMTLLYSLLELHCSYRSLSPVLNYPYFSDWIPSPQVHHYMSLTVLS